MYDSIIFDMDGTLINSVERIKEAWNLSTKNHNIKKVFSNNDIMGIMGMNPENMAKTLFPDSPLKKGMEWIKILSHEEIAYVEENKYLTFVPNNEFLEKLSKKYKLFIVSNCIEGYIEVFYKNFGVEKYFIDYQNAANGLSKGQNIKAIVERNGLLNPVYVGDTMGDYEASKEANVDFIHASYGFGKVDNVKKINNIEELLKIDE